MFHMKKYLLICLMSLSLLGCYDLINQPLSGEGGESAIFSIAGNWLEKNQKTSLQLIETENADEFAFIYQENGKVWQGEVVASYYGERVALNVDLLSLTLGGEKIFSQNEPLYLLLGAYYKKKDLYIIEADMEKFRKKLAKYFYANQFSTGNSCLKHQAELCKKSFTNKYVLSPKNNKKFNDEFDKSFKSIFPKDKALVFEAVAE